MQATVAQYYEKHGRHRIYAGDHFVPLTRCALARAESDASRRRADGPRRSGDRQDGREEKLKARGPPRAGKPGEGGELEPGVAAQFARFHGTAEGASRPARGRADAGGTKGRSWFSERRARLSRATTCRSPACLLRLCVRFMRTVAHGSRARCSEARRTPVCSNAELRRRRR